MAARIDIASASPDGAWRRDRGALGCGLLADATGVTVAIVAAYWFTASTSFANPAVTLAFCLFRHFPARQVPLVSQLTGNLGQLGALGAAAPMTWALGEFGWTRAYLAGAVAGLVVGHAQVRLEERETDECQATDEVTDHCRDLVPEQVVGDREVARDPFPIAQRRLRRRERVRVLGDRCVAHDEQIGLHHLPRK